MLAYKSNYIKNSFFLHICVFHDDYYDDDNENFHLLFPGFAHAKR